MALITNGLITTGMTKGGGKLLLTNEHVHVLKEDEVNPLQLFLFGAVGHLLARLLGRIGRPDEPPAFLSSSEVAELSAAQLRSIRHLEPIERFPISPLLDAERSRGGVLFNVGLRQIRFTSYLSQKKIAAFLADRGVAVK